MSAPTTSDRRPAPSDDGQGELGRLTELRIRGLGSIDDVTLELGRGLTVVTGETAAQFEGDVVDRTQPADAQFGQPAELALPVGGGGGPAVTRRRS